MEPQFKTSFIPKKTLAQSASPRRGRGSSVGGILFLITGILALLTIALAVGVFLYIQFLEGSIVRKSETLERARAAFEPALIQELVRLDGRIKAGQTLLERHISPASFFKTLEEQTLPSVRYLRFDMSEASNGMFTLAIEGEAESFNAVALQADIFGRDRVIRDPLFSGLNIDQQNNVVFQLNAFVDTSLIRYVNTPAATSGGTFEL